MVRVLQDELGRWFVEINGNRHNCVYHLSRADAIASGVRAAIQGDFALQIQGVDPELDQILPKNIQLH
ncbi:DUF2188 domain-containing protein [Cupriavidus nantongensis]